MQREVGIALMKRALAIMEDQWPEMANAHMQVPLEYYNSQEIAEREREIFETSGLEVVLAPISTSDFGARAERPVRAQVLASVILGRPSHSSPARGFLAIYSLLWARAGPHASP